MPSSRQCPACSTLVADRVLGGLCTRCVSGWVLDDTAPPAPATPSPRAAGTASGLSIGRLGDYELVEEIGRGGMGVIYRARQTSLDRWVALKLMHATPLTRRDHEHRFLHEARLVARFRHPGIV